MKSYLKVTGHKISDRSLGQRVYVLEDSGLKGSNGKPLYRYRGELWRVTPDRVYRIAHGKTLPLCYIESTEIVSQPARPSKGYARRKRRY